MGTPLYRIRQLVRAAQAPPLNEAELQRVQAVLNDAAFALYQTMPPGDQRHSLEIFDALYAQGVRAQPLLEAALLHDVAKREVGLGYRTGVVVLNRLAPGALPRIASPVPGSWRYPFYVSLYHPELGAELAAQTGIDPDALALIRAHQNGAYPFRGRAANRLAAWHQSLKMLDDAN
jgi:hypothetical protein